MLKREIKLTNDGSKTLYIPEWNESYHSKHGALQEAYHVFIQHGLEHYNSQQKVHILEYGFGTGLNCLVSYLYAKDQSIKISYSALEKYPIKTDEVKSMNFIEQISDNRMIDKYSLEEIYHKMHNVDWNRYIAIDESFELKKIQVDFREFTLNEYPCDLVYFDAFGMRVQPELWDKPIFSKIYRSLKIGGLLTTYAANGKTKRALENCGFEVQKLAGPPGKREMINAWKR